MAPLDLSRFRFAGFVVCAARALSRIDGRVPRFSSVYRYMAESGFYGSEMADPGHADDFQLDRSLRERIPRRIKMEALQAVSDLAADKSRFARPNVCLSRDAVRSLLAASRVPRNAIQILEAGIPDMDAEVVLAREGFSPEAPGERPNSHGLVIALTHNRRMSGEGQVLGLEPWYLNHQLTYSWRVRHDDRAVRTRAFSRLNEHGLLKDLIDFDLFLPGLTPRVVRNLRARWIPVLLVEHSVESIIGDLKVRSVRSQL